MGGPKKSQLKRLEERKTDKDRERGERGGGGGAESEREREQLEESVISVAALTHSLSIQSQQLVALLAEVS